MQDTHIKESLKNWWAMVVEYQKPNARKAIGQLLNTFLPFIGLWILMYFSLDWSYLLTLGLAGIAAFFLVRIFIIQHDCGHQSFLGYRKLNNVIGFISSFFSTIPYNSWSRTHAEHHAINAQLEFRGLGDIHFLTTEEYNKRSKWGKLRYRVFRHPVMLFVIAPIFYRAISIRIPFLRLKGWRQVRWAHWANNLLLLLIYGTLAMVLGWQKFLLVHVPVVVLFGVIAFWFFYVQHQHEENYKEWKDKWDHLLASVKGSTYYKLPRVFQWLSGNIGYHHIHHLNSRIPNYHLEACAKENPDLNKYVTVLTFRESLKCMHYKLWDEKTKRMITFREYVKERE
ncbi:MAG: fatty acid desaturase [Saprospirales bacterium]|nr:fatty acid desaturase [Saprospirales bacterium]